MEHLDQELDQDLAWDLDQELGQGQVSDNLYLFRFRPSEFQDLELGSRDSDYKK